MPLTATAVWTISPALVLALDEQLGPPVDSYVNGSQTWLVESGDITLEWRLHPVAGYRVPAGASHYDVWEGTVSQLSLGDSPTPSQLSLGNSPTLRLGDEERALTSLWDGLECYAAYGDELEPHQLAATAGEQLGIPPERVGLVDHELIADEWERAQGGVSIFGLLLAQLRS